MYRKISRNYFKPSCEIKIEQKLFLICLGRRGNTVLITERTRNASYVLEMDIDSFHWTLAKLWEYINKPQSGTMFNRFRGREAVMSMQKFVNGRGNYLEISKIVWKGKTQRIIIPSGRLNEGWKWMANTLSQISTNRWDNKSSFKDGRKTTTQTQQRGHLRQNAKDSGVPDDIGMDQLPECKSKEWRKAIIITKDCVNISWEMVTNALGKAVKRKIEVFPFQANKAVWWPQNEEDASFYLRMKKSFLENRVTLSFERWNQHSNTEEEVYECCNSWVRLLGIPWDLWSTELFKNIGQQCGGLLNISQDTILLKDLSAAKIKVMGMEGGFINRNLLIETVRGPLNIRILVDSVNIEAYAHHEKRSYAQAVVNGDRVMPGWGRGTTLKDKETGAEETHDIHPRRMNNSTLIQAQTKERVATIAKECVVMKNCNNKLKEDHQSADRGDISEGRNCTSEPCRKHRLQNGEASKRSIEDVEKDSILAGNEYWVENLNQRMRDDISDEGGEFSDAGSHISDQSDKLTRHSLEFDDLGEFFEESPSKVCKLPYIPSSHHCSSHSINVSDSLLGLGGGLEVKFGQRDSSVGHKLGVSGNKFLGHLEGGVEGEKDVGLGILESKNALQNECLERMGVEKVGLKESVMPDIRLVGHVDSGKENPREVEVNR
ncbi:uncharacterized protein [Primulina eburnea]|uniref:uncharacterized protein n=1 Tax=Primulina eburnea TaxID=1245227 RepID=UPI003C6C3193